jgi:FAD/FMN-containing dehydrogenase
MEIYYRSIRAKSEDWLTAAGYIWRWDTDWFWCSRNLYVQQPLLRRLVGRRFLNSVSYTKVMRWNSRWQATKRLNRLLGIHTESVIQDVDIPVAKAPEFLEFFQREIGITPIWICPVQAYDPAVRFPLFALQPGTLYVNFGFWDVVRSREARPAGYYNRKIEQKVAELGGIKSLYSESFYPAEEFWRYYDRTAYSELKTKYDPQDRFKDLYRKTVLRE